MNRLGRAVLMLYIGGVVGRLVLTGGFGWFVQQHMRIPLLAASAVLLVFGLYEGVASTRGDRSEADPRGGGEVAAPDESRSVGPVIGWLMITPLLVLMSVAPTALGAAAATRTEAFTPLESSDRFATIDDSDGPVELRVYDFLERALWDAEGSLDGVEVLLRGIVVNDPEVDGGFKLTRFMVSCCAADGIPLQITVYADDVDLPDDTWVEAVVTWHEPDIPYDEVEGVRTVEADAVSVTVMDEPPADPYESPY